MSRRTFVYVDGVAYERGVDEIPETNDIRSQAGEGVLWGDRHYDGQRSQDGHDISTRTKHREYMAAKGLTMASDFTEQWKRQTAEREQSFITGGDHKQRRADTIEAARQVTEALRRRR